MRSLLFAAILLSPAIVSAAPLKLPKLYPCVASSGAITVKAKCGAGETKLIGTTLNSMTSISKCRSVSASRSGGGGFTVDLSCTCNEYLLNYNWNITGNNAGALEVYPQQTMRLTCGGNPFPSGIKFLFFTSSALSYSPYFTAEVEGVCCPIN